jgi:hypothetical protein
MFNTINRDVLILKPKQALFDWVQEVFGDELLEEGDPFEHDESNVYLIPELRHYSESLEYLKENYQLFLEDELEDWVLDEEDWPKDVSWEKFQEFFHISIQSVVCDTLNEPIIAQDEED